MTDHIVQAFMDQLCEKKPDMVTREVICKSIQNRQVSPLISLETNENVVSETQDKIYFVENNYGTPLPDPWCLIPFAFLWQKKNLVAKLETNCNQSWAQRR
jgi:hypothetical protein